MLSFDSQVAPFWGGLSCIHRVFIGCYWQVLEMHGGMAVYRNTPTAARHYLEADRSRADDYYLVEGTGLAEHFSASPTLGVRHRGTLSGDV